MASEAFAGLERAAFVTKVEPSLDGSAWRFEASVGASEAVERIPLPTSVDTKAR